MKIWQRTSRSKPVRSPTTESIGSRGLCPLRERRIPGFHPTVLYSGAVHADGGASNTQPVEIPFTAAGLALFQERRANNSKDDPEGYCLPAGIPRCIGTPYPFQIVQLPDRVVILYEGASHTYRVIPMGAKHSANPDPSWLGESLGWREGNDTLVVDTIGFNGRTWLDYVGHPASDQLHVIEKFRRPDSLHDAL